MAGTFPHQVEDAYYPGVSTASVRTFHFSYTGWTYEGMRLERKLAQVQSNEWTTIPS